MKSLPSGWRIGTRLFRPSFRRLSIFIVSASKQQPSVRTNTINTNTQLSTVVTIRKIERCQNEHRWNDWNYFWTKTWTLPCSGTCSGYHYRMEHIICCIWYTSYRISRGFKKRIQSSSWSLDNSISFHVNFNPVWIVNCSLGLM